MRAIFVDGRGCLPGLSRSNWCRFYVTCLHICDLRPCSLAQVCFTAIYHNFAYVRCILYAANTLLLGGFERFCCCSPGSRGFIRWRYLFLGENGEFSDFPFNTLLGYLPTWSLARGGNNTGKRHFRHHSIMVFCGQNWVEWPMIIFLSDCSSSRRGIPSDQK
jgi:hypothetical protein